MAQPSVNDIKYIVMVMSILEGACARIAVERMTPTDFKKIELTHQLLELHFEANYHERYLEVNQNWLIVPQY